MGGGGSISPAHEDAKGKAVETTSDERSDFEKQVMGFIFMDSARS